MGPGIIMTVGEHAAVGHVKSFDERRLVFVDGMGKEFEFARADIGLDQVLA